MNFKKFVASLAVSTMLVGSQVAVYADEKSPKSSQSQNETIGIVKKVAGGAGYIYTTVDVLAKLTGKYGFALQVMPNKGIEWGKIVAIDEDGKAISKKSYLNDLLVFALSSLLFV
jgi:hypothetical protein